MQKPFEFPRKIILGSNSPRRRELLSAMGIEFTVDTDNSFIETVPDGTPAGQVPVILSRGKSHGFHRPLLPDELLITADTVVILPDGKEGVIFGKPKDRNDALSMLHALSGRTHEVITAVCLRTLDLEYCFTDSTKVHFAALSDSEAEYYTDKFRPFDKAGAYGIQEWIGHIGIEWIDGSYNNVVGFPTQKLWKALQERFSCISLRRAS
ncbi:MAG: septum formation protein Maf [Bacteroidales bacterium]|nr:septum formation protein Maf [Bacteroidales bacterium]